MHRNKLIGIILGGVLSALFMWGGYCLWFYLGENEHRQLNPVRVPYYDWQVVQGEGSIQDSEIRLSAPGSLGEVLAVGRPTAALEADKFDRILVEFMQVGAYQTFSVGISQSKRLGGIAEAPVSWRDERIAELGMRDLGVDDGEIQFVTLRIRGSLEPDAVIESVRIQRRIPGFVELQKLILQTFLDTSGWSHRSINFNKADYVPLALSPVVAAAMWIVLTILVHSVLLWLREGRVHVGFLLGCGGFVLVLGWVFLDLTWQVSLWKRHLMAIDQYAGLTSSEKRRSEFDGEVFDFVVKIKAEIPDESIRLVIFASSDSAHFRARYFAIPQPTISRTGVSERWVRRLGSGDVFALIDMPGSLKKIPIAAYDAAEKSAREWPLSEIVGRDARIMDCTDVVRPGTAECSSELIAFKEDKGPWLVESPWFTGLSSGVWQLKVETRGVDHSGWVRLEVRRRHDEGSGRWAWRETYINAHESDVISLPFNTTGNERLRFRLQVLGRTRVSVTQARIEPVDSASDLVRLGLEDGPPYFIARKLVQTQSGAAWELL